MVYHFELRRQLPSALIWSGVIAAVLLLLLYGFYPVFLDARTAMEDYIASFPPALAASFGFDLDDMFSFESFSGLIYLYESVLSSIAVTTAALAVFAREKQNKCADFLLTKPRSRAALFSKKLLCCLTVVALQSVPYLVLCVGGYFHYTGASQLTAAMALSALCLPLTQLVFLSFGAFLGVFLRRVRSAAGLGTGIGIFAFLLSAVHSLTEKEAFKFFSPLFYFSPNAVLETGGYDAACVLTAAMLTLGLLGAAFFRYTGADVAA